MGVLLTATETTPIVVIVVERTRVASVMHCVIHTSAPDAVLCV